MAVKIARNSLQTFLSFLYFLNLKSVNRKSVMADENNTQNSAATKNPVDFDFEVCIVILHAQRIY